MRAFSSQRTLFEFDNLSVLKKNNHEINKVELESAIVTNEEFFEFVEETNKKNKKNY